MTMIGWIGQNWFALLQTGGVVGALVLTSVALLLDARARQVGNLIDLTHQHRKLWERMYTKPELARILDPDVDLAREPVTSDEELFVIFLILHLSSTYYAMRTGFLRRLDGLRKDIQLFFALPMPRAVWEKVKDLQDKKFVAFVESCLPEETSQ